MEKTLKQSEIDALFEAARRATPESAQDDARGNESGEWGHSNSWHGSGFSKTLIVNRIQGLKTFVF